MKHSQRFVQIVDDGRSRVPEITLEEALVEAAEEKAILIDVREKEEFDNGHIPDALHMSKGTIERDIEKTIPEMDRPLILYCGGGSRSILASENLQRMGYTNVRSMSGGYRGYKKHNESEG